MHSDLAGFAGVAALVTIAPAADFALVSRRTIGEGVRTAVITASGVCCGVLVWGALSAVGVAALLAASADTYNVLRLAGAAYLVFLGVQALLRARQLSVGQERLDGCASGPNDGAAFRQGLVTNLLNPKVRVFYSAVLPQFVSHRDPAAHLIALCVGARADGDGLVRLQRARALTWTAGVRPATRAFRARNGHRRGPDRPGRRVATEAR